MIALKVIGTEMEIFIGIPKSFVTLSKEPINIHTNFAYCYFFKNRCHAHKKAGA
jgi:hypothetical protein